MDTQLLSEKFEAMGARLKVGPLVASRRPSVGREISVNILRDRKGEYFELLTAPGNSFRVEALDVRPKDRHLLLMVARTDGGTAAPDGKQKFLCGHDERSWFVAAVPGASASTVTTAMEALKPAGVREAQSRHKVKAAHRNRRKNRGFVRQGEWFFVPCPDMQVAARHVLRDEPMQRSGGKAHWAEFAFRTGGETVYVSREYPSGLTAEQFKRLTGGRPTPADGFRVMQRNANVFVKGRISHPDHKTIRLPYWHRVEMNTESQAPAMRNVAFLD